MVNRYKIIRIYFFLFVLFGIYSCTTQEDDFFDPIKIGKEDKSIDHVLLNIGNQRNLILSGGNGKYTVNIADSKIADVKISYDTLKIYGLQKGQTFATIVSHNQKRKLNLQVEPLDVSISQQFIKMYPTQESRIVSLSGGDIVNLEVLDPEDIIDVKWNGNTEILEILAKYEGEATILAVSDQQVTQKLIVKVQAEGDAKEVGIYDITGRYIQSVLTPVMVVERQNVGTWLSGSTNPYGVSTSTYNRVAVRFSPISNPKKNNFINLQVQLKPYLNNYYGLVNGENKFYVEDIQDSKIILKTKVSKIVLPFE